MSEKLTSKEAIDSLTLKFTSENSVDVERATILRKEWDAIKPILDYYIKNSENFRVSLGFCEICGGHHYDGLPPCNSEVEKKL